MDSKKQMFDAMAAMVGPAEMKRFFAEYQQQRLAPSKEKPQWAFKMCEVCWIEKGTNFISNFSTFIGAHYNFMHDLTPILTMTKDAAVSWIQERRCYHGERLSKQKAAKLYEFVKKGTELKGKLVVSFQCGKKGTEWGGEIRRITGNYEFNTNKLEKGDGCSYFHRFSTERVRKLEPHEFNLVDTQLGNNPSLRYRLQWPIEI